MGQEQHGPSPLDTNTRTQTPARFAVGFRQIAGCCLEDGLDVLVLLDKDARLGLLVIEGTL